MHRRPVMKKDGEVVWMLAALDPHESEVHTTANGSEFSGSALVSDIHDLTLLSFAGCSGAACKISRQVWY